MSKRTNLMAIKGHSDIQDRVLDIETKKMVQYIFSTVNISKGKRYRCWWCTLIIDHKPIGCPIDISYVDGTKTYSTDGIFCSFNCVKAYINDKERLDIMYKNSHILLAHMVCDMNNCISPVSVEPAPDKKMLVEYGGHMTDDQYRYCFDRMLYDERGIIKMFPTVSIIQEEEKLNNRGGSKSLYMSNGVTTSANPS